MGNHAYQKEFPLRGWRGVMSAPRRIGLAERDGRLQLAQHIEPAVAGLFSVPERLGAGMVPVASRIELDGDFCGAITVHDGKASSLVVDATDRHWQFRRQDAALPFLDCETSVERHDGQGLSLWIDSETIEALTFDGTGSASFQHRPATNRITIDTDHPGHISIATLA